MNFIFKCSMKYKLIQNPMAYIGLVKYKKVIEVGIFTED